MWMWMTEAELFRKRRQDRNFTCDLQRRSQDPLADKNCQHVQLKLSSLASVTNAVFGGFENKSSEVKFFTQFSESETKRHHLHYIIHYLNSYKTTFWKDLNLNIIDNWTVSVHLAPTRRSEIFLNVGIQLWDSLKCSYSISSYIFCENVLQTCVASALCF